MNTAKFFESYYANAQLNNILIMDVEGNVLEVNPAFTENYGYTTKDLNGQHFSSLFNAQDRQMQKPQIELDKVLATGQAYDENYVLCKQGKFIWSLGECMLVKNEAGDQFIVKDLINMQAQKQLDLLLIDTEELLENIFDTTSVIPMLVLDSTLRVQKANEAFLSLFELEEMPLAGSRLSDFNHPFWMNVDLKKDITAMIINNQPIRDKDYLLPTNAGDHKIVKLATYITDSKSQQGRNLYILFKDV